MYLDNEGIPYPAKWEVDTERLDKRPRFPPNVENARPFPAGLTLLVELIAHSGTQAMYSASPRTNQWTRGRWISSSAYAKLLPSDGFLGREFFKLCRARPDH